MPNWKLVSLVLGVGLVTQSNVNAGIVLLAALALTIAIEMWEAIRG